MPKARQPIVALSCYHQKPAVNPRGLLATCKSAEAIRKAAAKTAGTLIDPWPTHEELLAVAREALADMTRAPGPQEPCGPPATEPRKPPEAPALERWASGADVLRFPVHVFPPLLREYIAARARSIHCVKDLLAVPLLAVAGAATGRSGRRLKVKDGWAVSSCLWAACMTSSSGGKTPALNAVQNFYEDRQEDEHCRYQEAKRAHEEEEGSPPPGPYPALKMTDTTIEALRVDLGAGAVLFIRDELGGWCHQMGQYKAGNADRSDWCSFWSHSPVSITRKTERLYVKEPFVAVTGMMVPSSARELNYRGQADDGFVHRMLLACPESLPPVATLEGVPDELTDEYKRRMTRLFDAPEEGGQTLAFEPAALDMLLRWTNDELYASLAAPRDENGRVIQLPFHPQQDAPDWMRSKYGKLYENCLRLCLVLHEIWRVAGDWERPDEGDEAASVLRAMSDYWTDDRDFYGKQIEFQPGVVDRITVERAIAVTEYFWGHIGAVQELFGEEVDEVDRLYGRLKSKGTVTTREVTHASTYKQADRVLALFADWQRRGYGEVQHPRKNQTVFRFAAG